MDRSSSSPPRLTRRRAVLLIAAATVAVVLYFAWPLHGFVSHQFGIARTPWGWLDLPAQAPEDAQTLDETYARAGEFALQVVEAHRGKIGAPSLSVALAKDGRLVWQGASGWADVASKIPATPATAYRIGSTSKAVTATLFARMVDQGVVDPEAPLERYLPEVPNPDWASITLRQLDSHTAGIVGYEENTDWVGLYQSMALTSHFDDPVDALDVFDSSDLLFAPGTGYHYSSYDVVVVSAALQKAGDRPFLQLVDSEVTQPLGLAPLGADSLLPFPGPVATFYDRRDGQFRPWREVDLSHKLAGGGFIATPAQLASIGMAWLDDSFISPQTRDLFWTPVRLANGQVNDEDYALGWRRKTWELAGLGAVENLNHGGISKGSQCWLMVVPEHNAALAACMNALTDEFFDFADVAADILPIFLFE